MNQPRRNLHYLKYPTNLVAILIIISVAFSCIGQSSKSPHGQYRTLEKYLTKQHHLTLNNNIRTIAILSEHGCPGCNKKFAEYLSQQQGNMHLLIDITASGNWVDLSPFQKNPSAQILYDSKDEISTIFNLNSSSIIFVSNQKIDTIIQLDGTNISNSIIQLNSTPN